MKKILHHILIFILTIMLPFMLFIFCLEKVLAYGVTDTKGVVLSVSTGLLYECVTISQTTVGESVTKEFCQYSQLDSEFIEPGDKVYITYLGNFIPFGNKAKVLKQ